MYRITEVVKHLLILNVLVYFGTLFLLGDPYVSDTNEIAWGRMQLAMFYPTSDYFQPFQIVTHMFMHGNTMHLFFNMFGLFMFGPPLESMWGPKRFLFYYLITGFGALLLNLLVIFVQHHYLGGVEEISFYHMVGASGAIFGLLAGYGLSFPENRIMLLFPPIPMKAKYFVLIYAGIELFLGVGGVNTGIAHFAHLGGALFGLLLILYWRKYGSSL